MYRLLRNNVWFRLWGRYLRPIVRFFVRLNNATNDLLRLLVLGIDRFINYGPHEAAALSYYALFSLFPLMLLLIVISTFFIDTESASAQIGDIVTIFFPGQTSNILKDAIQAAVDQRGSVSIFAIIVLGWSSASLFGNLEKVLGRAFGVEKRRRIYQRRLIGLVMIVALIVFLLASIITNLLFNFLDLLFLNQSATWLRMASFLVPTAFNAAIFAMLYGFVTSVRLRWDAILPASLMGGLAFEFAKRSFVYYLSSLTDLNFVYGSVTTVVIFMLWAFITFCLILIFAEVCSALDAWLEANEIKSTEQVPIPPVVIETLAPLHRLPPPE